jgi:hypothetical protein
VTGFLILGQVACWDTAERDDHSCHTRSKGPNLDLLGLVYYGKVALSGEMLVVGSVMVVVAHSAGSSTAVVAASVHWVFASEAVVVAFKIEGAAFALTSMAGSSVVD